MTAQDRWKKIQAVLGTTQDGIPGVKDSAAWDKLRSEAMAEHLAAKVGVELGYMDGSGIIQRPNGSIFFYAGLHIDADGSPRAYHPEKGKGLDYLANAGSPGNWWGIAVDPQGKPYIQGPDDPAPGYYISTTALVNSQYAVNDPRRYIDSETVPFIVLPSNFPAKIKLGTKCRVTDVQRNVSVEAIYADRGPRFQLGEGSIALAKALGINPDPKKGGTERKLLYEILPD
jgi:hypothetical protein